MYHYIYQTLFNYISELGDPKFTNYDRFYYSSVLRNLSSGGDKFNSGPGRIGKRPFSHLWLSEGRPNLLNRVSTQRYSFYQFQSAVITKGLGNLSTYQSFLGIFLFKKLGK